MPDTLGLTSGAQMDESARATRAAVWFAALIAATGVGGLALAAYIGGQSATEPPPPTALARVSDGAATPAPDDFPVWDGEKRLLGSYVGGRGVGFAVLEQQRCDLAPGVPPPEPGEDIFSLRLAVGTDSAVPTDLEGFDYRLYDTESVVLEAASVSAPGRILPGPRLALVDVHFHLDRDRTPAALVIQCGGESVRLPACPVPAERANQPEVSQ